MRITDHFRSHGHVHAIWIIALLVAIVAWLLLGERDGKVINEYISFASSLASLILAVVAIFYAIVSTQSQSESVGALNASVREIASAAGNISRTSAALEEKAESMIGEVRGIAPAFEDLRNRVNAASLDTAPKTPTGLSILDNVSYGGKVGFYLVALSLQQSKGFNPYNVFENDAVWSNWIMGFLHAVRAWKPCGVILDFASDDENYVFRASVAGQFPTKDIIARIEETHSLDEQVKSIKDYFADDVEDGKVKTKEEEE